MFTRSLYTSLLLIFTISTALNAQQNWYKGNTHTHTTYSDGKLPLSEVREAYVNEGYDFLFITDEDEITPVDTLSDSTFLCFTGEEAIIDKHVSCLNIDSSVAPTMFTDVINKTYEYNGFAVVNHPRRGSHEVSPKIRMFYVEKSCKASNTRALQLRYFHLNWCCLTKYRYENTK